MNGNRNPREWDPRVGYAMLVRVPDGALNRESAWHGGVKPVLARVTDGALNRESARRVLVR